MNKIELHKTSDRRQLLFVIPSEDKFSPTVSQTLPTEIALELKRYQEIVERLYEAKEKYLEKSEISKEAREFTSYHIYANITDVLGKILENTQNQ